MGMSGASGADSSSAKEYQIKAAFVYNFLKFVEYPAGRFEKTNSPVVIGVVGNSTMTAALEMTVKHRKLNGRDILVKTVETLEGTKESHILFFPASEDKLADVFLAPAAAADVLTVGESAAFAEKNGMINFVLEGDKVRFEINMDAVGLSQLKVSAQLQKLAKAVRRKSN